MTLRCMLIHNLTYHFPKLLHGHLPHGFAGVLPGELLVKLMELLEPLSLEERP